MATGEHEPVAEAVPALAPMPAAYGSVGHSGSSSFGWVSYSPAVMSSGDRGGRSAVAALSRLGRAVTQPLSGRRARQSSLFAILRQHLGDGVEELSVVEESWPAYEHINVQAGLDAWLSSGPRRSRLVGVVGFQHHEFGLGELLDPGFAGEHSHGPRPGSVARANVPSGPRGQVTPCVRCGIYLVDDGTRRTVLLLRGPERHSMHEGVTVQIASTEAEHAVEAAAEIREEALRSNVYRGQVLSFGGDVFGDAGALLHFHERPVMSSSQLVLPADVLSAVRRQVVDVGRHKQRMLAAGQHLKRGVLLFGPPGVGKTHTVRYLVSQLTGVTVVQLTGTSLHLIAEACSVARTLQPAMLVVEDVDLIAEERGGYGGEHPLLFQLLNEMDGLAEDADIVFVLTTNRADLLEPALAARPGRVDQAVELTLPDGGARRALFDLYRGDLDVDTAHLDDVLQRTEGVTASFLKELLRRAALLSADRLPERERLQVSSADLSNALDELLDTRNAMTRVLLGGRAPEPPALP